MSYGKETYRLNTGLNKLNQRKGMENLLYLPKLKRNLLYVQATSKLGTTVVLKKVNTDNMSKNSKMLLVGEVCRTLYIVKVIQKEKMYAAKKVQI